MVLSRKVDFGAGIPRRTLSYARAQLSLAVEKRLFLIYVFSTKSIATLFALPTAVEIDWPHEPSPGRRLLA